MDIFIKTKRIVVNFDYEEALHMNLHNFLHNTLGFSNYEIAQIQFFTNSILSEISKILIIGGFFLIIDMFDMFIPATLTLCCLRTCTGGLHFKHYLSCLAVSFAIFFIDITILNKFVLIKPVQLLLLIICAIINYLCAPIVSVFRPIPNGVRILRSKRQATTIISFYFVLVFILPTTSYLNVGFWMILLQSIELLVAKFIVRRNNRNETTCYSCND